MIQLIQLLFSRMVEATNFLGGFKWGRLWAGTIIAGSPGVEINMFKLSNWWPEKKGIGWNHTIFVCLSGVGRAFSIDVSFWNETPNAPTLDDIRNYTLWCLAQDWMSKHTVDGGNLAPVDRWFIHVYPIIYRVSTIRDGPGFRNHPQYFFTLL